MIRRFALIIRRSVAPLCLLTMVSCGGGKPSSTPTTLPTPVATATPVPAPTPVQGCKLGDGSGKFTCQGDVPGLLPKLDLAIDALVAQHPEIFNLNDPSSAGGYLVLDPVAYYDGVIDNLAAQGLCAQRDAIDHDKLVIKDSNSYDETYDILTSQNRVRRGPVTYVVTCTPAHFPLTADEAVASVLVRFFRYTECTNTSPPPNTLPLGCRGTITATPRDAMGNKLPPELHGSDVTWFTQYGDGVTISVSPSSDGIPFNLVLVPKQLGEFSVCATVESKTGCLNGQVIP
jgi:hypothetical protein